MQDWRQTVLSQYQNSPVLLELIRDFNEWIDPAQDFQRFYDDIWNIHTAQGYGLDVWGRIVGVSRYLTLTSTKAFGFAHGFYPFNEAPFFNGTGSHLNFALSDEPYRLLILVKAMANITSCTIPALNKLISYLFKSRGKCYVRDLGGMAMAYEFEFALTQVEFAILSDSGVIPRPAGVSVSFIYPGA